MPFDEYAESRSRKQIHAELERLIFSFTHNEKQIGEGRLSNGIVFPLLKKL